MNDLAAQVSRMDVFVDKLIDFCTSAGIRILLALIIRFKVPAILDEE